MAEWRCSLCPERGEVSGWGTPEAARDAAVSEYQRHYQRKHREKRK
jgi:hypothetical protein